MEKSSGLTKYMNGPVGNAKPKRNNVLWEPKEIEALLEDASRNLDEYGDPMISILAQSFRRTEKAINIKLSREGWFKAKGFGKKAGEKIREGTLKLKVLDYIKKHPYCFCRDIDTMLDVNSSSILTVLTKDGVINRIRHRGNGAYLYCFNEPSEITLQDISKEVLTELQPAKKESFLHRIRRLFGGV
jgi:hypothetical protein